MLKIVRCTCIVVMGLILAGFSPVMKHSATEKENAKAKLFEPDSTRALIYVFRDNSFLGQSAVSQLVINNMAVTNNERNQFSVVALAPGNYALSCHSSKESNVAANIIHNKSKDPLQVVVEGGKIYYFQEVFKAMSGFSLKIVSEEEAKPRIKKCKLAALYQL